MALSYPRLKGTIGFCLQIGAPIAASLAAAACLIAMNAVKGPVADIPTIQQSAKVIAHYAMLSPLITGLLCIGLFLVGHNMRDQDRFWNTPRPTQ